MKEPLYVWRDGSLSLTIWENHPKEGVTTKTVSINNGYKKKGEEKWTNKKLSLSLEKALKLLKPLQLVEEQFKN